MDTTCNIYHVIQTNIVNQPFKHTFSQHVSGKQYYEALFYDTDLGQYLFFFCPILFLSYNSAVFHNFARQFALIQYPRRQSTRFLFTTNYSIES